MKLHYTEGGLRRIAQKAVVKNTGARGLRSTLETVLTEAMYQVSLPQTKHCSVHGSNVSVIELCFFDSFIVRNRYA